MGPLTGLGSVGGLVWPGEGMARMGPQPGPRLVYAVGVDRSGPLRDARACCRGRAVGGLSAGVEQEPLVSFGRRCLADVSCQEPFLR